MMFKNPILEVHSAHIVFQKYEAPTVVKHTVNKSRTKMFFIVKICTRVYEVTANNPMEITFCPTCNCSSTESKHLEIQPYKTRYIKFTDEDPILGIGLVSQGALQLQEDTSWTYITFFGEYFVNHMLE